MLTDWYQKSMNALALNGKAGRTQEAYSRALRMLCELYDNKAPEDIGEAELEAYFLHRRNVDHWSANTLHLLLRHPLLLREGSPARLEPVQHPSRQERIAPAARWHRVRLDRAVMFLLQRAHTYEA